MMRDLEWKPFDSPTRKLVFNHSGILSRDFIHLHLICWIIDNRIPTWDSQHSGAYNLSRRL